MSGLVLHSGAVVQIGKLAQVIAYSLVVGIGITAVFSLAVSSTAGFLDALRDRRTTRAVAWGAVGTLCVAVTLAGMVRGIVVMSTK